MRSEIQRSNCIIVLPVCQDVLQVNLTDRLVLPIMKKNSLRFLFFQSNFSSYLWNFPLNTTISRSFDKNKCPAAQFLSALRSMNFMFLIWALRHIAISYNVLLRCHASSTSASTGKILVLTILCIYLVYLWYLPDRLGWRSEFYKFKGNAKFLLIIYSQQSCEDFVMRISWSWLLWANYRWRRSTAFLSNAHAAVVLVKIQQFQNKPHAHTVRKSCMAISPDPHQLL